MGLLKLCLHLALNLLTLNFSTIDLIAFAAFIAAVMGISLYASRKEKGSEDYFLAGRNLSWWLIGISLIASNISTEHFVGMAGKGFELGLAIASYEWMAAVTLVVVGLFFLPRFIRSGIYTIPEYLEYRYDHRSRTLMAIFMLVAYIFVALASVLYSGALAMEAIFGLKMIYGVWLTGVIAGLYTIYGGLKAVVWSDLLQGITLILGGVFVTLLGAQALGGWDVFFELSPDKLHTVLPWNHSEMPWVAVFVGGLWIPNLFYWGLNQFITQRTLGAKSIVEGQKGILLAASIKLFIPFIIVFPGIMAYHLYGADVENPDAAYPTMINTIVPSGLRGVMFAALFGAVLSSLDSMLNSASTIFTMDIYKKYIKPEADHISLMKIGRIVTLILVLVGCLYAPFIARFGSVFNYIQMIWGFISPGIVAVFILGIVYKKASPIAAFSALILGIPLYAVLLIAFPKLAFLHAMGLTFLVLVIWIIGVSELATNQYEPKPIPVKLDKNAIATPSYIYWWSGLVVACTAALYVVFY